MSTDWTDSPSIGARIGRSLLAFVMFPLAGIPYVVGIGIESAFFAWLVTDPLPVWDTEFSTAFAWIFGVQIAPMLLFALIAWPQAVVQAWQGKLGD